MFADDVMALLRKQDGLSDREITDVLCGKHLPQQPTNQACRNLASRGLVLRCKRLDGIFGNYLVKGQMPVNAPENVRAMPRFTVEIPRELSSKARELGVLWAASSKRPRVKSLVQEHWDKLIDAWIADVDMPLALRKQGQGYPRGSVVLHEETGREVIWTDNSPAQWAFYCAWQSHEYSLEEIKKLLADHKIPFAFASKRSDTDVKYLGTIGSSKVDLNKLGWKLCHIREVSIASRTPPQRLSIQKLEDHFALLMKPSNHFLVPKQWSGLGEIPEVIEEIKRFENLEIRQ
jgi:hypothetical protein